MAPEKVDQEFLKAYEKVSRTDQKFPPDIMLKFYAYYKYATEQEGIYNPLTKNDVKSAFKLNALLQVKGISVLEAKQRYIDLVKEKILDPVEH